MDEDKPKIIAIVGPGVRRDIVEKIRVNIEDELDCVILEEGIECEEHLPLRYVAGTLGCVPIPSSFGYSTFSYPQERYKKWEHEVPFPRPPKVARCSSKHRGNPCKKKRR